jgi:uncharacterized protein YoaH (UPF0181 family)
VSRIIQWPELVMAGDWRAATLTNAVKAGRLRRIGRGLYTPSPDPAATVVRRNWIPILERHFDGAVIVDASARAGSPDADGQLYIDHPSPTPLVLPGLAILPRKGPGPLPGDQRLAGFFVSSTARGLLDNSGRAGGRYLSREALEIWIAQILDRLGEPRLNALRDEARELAASTGRASAFERLSEIIASALVTGEASAVVSHALQARASGDAYDLARHERFAAMATALADRAPGSITDTPEAAGRRLLLPFFEAYFSNYIEGTEFTLDEAEGIVFRGDVPAGRPADAHDVLGTYRLVADAGEMRVVPRDPDGLIEILLARHAAIMGGRPDKGPGEFKTRVNRAGASVFVAPDLVRGTLRDGFDIGRGLRDPFARAAYLMFLVSEVHPFADGNGRVARVMMNAELVAGGAVRIIIPTVFRGEYVSSLKAATNLGSFDALVAVLAFAQRWTAQVDFTSRASAERDLRRTNALVEPQVSEENNIRLLLPSALDRVAGNA